MKKDMGESPFPVATTGSLTLRLLAHFVRGGVQALRFSRRGKLKMREIISPLEDLKCK